MSNITVSLSDNKYAPWGLLTEEIPPRIILWLSIQEPSVEIELEDLTPEDYNRLIQSSNAGIISVEGIEIKPEQKEVFQPKNISTEEKPEIADKNTILDVTTLLQSEIKKRDDSSIKSGKEYEKVNEILSLPAAKAKKELKEMAKKGAGVSFFKACRKNEEKGKSRKTVLAVILELIRSKVAAINYEGRINSTAGTSSLADEYYDLIEEFEEETENE